MAMFTVLCLIISQCILYSEAFVLATDAQNEACVVGDSIIAFTSTVSTQTKEDVRNGTLIAQLAANRQHNHEKYPADWYKIYVDTLGHIGFVVQEFSYQTVTDNTFTIEQVVLEKLKRVTTSAQNALAKTAMDALGKLQASDKAVKLFVTQSTNATSYGNFQLIVCDQSPIDGEIVLHMAVMYFSAKKYDSRFLWSQWNKADITLHAGTQSVVLDEDVYAQVRQAIADKLKDVISRYVAKFSI